MRAGGVLQDPVPQPAHQVRQAAVEAALSEDGVSLRDRAALLREDGGQGDHRDDDQGHAHDRQLPVAEQQHGGLHVDVTELGTLRWWRHHSVPRSAIFDDLSQSPGLTIVTGDCGVLTRHGRHQDYRGSLIENSNEDVIRRPRRPVTSPSLTPPMNNSNPSKIVPYKRSPARV